MSTTERRNAAFKSSGTSALTSFDESSDTPSDHELLQIFYEISLAIGDSLVQRTMLSKSLSTYLKKLECSMGAVIHAKNEGGTLSFDIAYSIPRNFERQASDYEEIIRKQGPEVAKEGLDVIKGKRGNNFYYIMSLSDIGLLFLLKQHAPLEDHIIDALRPLNTKLGKAFRACLQSEAYIQNNQQFMQMTNMLPGILFEIDTQKKITFINKRTYEIFKTIDSDQFKPKTIYELFKKNEIPKLDDLFRKIEEGTAMVSADSWMQTMRGALLPVSLNLSPINRDQKIVGFRGIATDISERIKYENKQKQLLKQLSENIREMNCLYGISRLTSDSDLSLDEIFNEGVNLIPGSFENEDVISAEIKFQEQRYESRDFYSTDNWIFSDIFINGEKAGTVSVFAPEEYSFQKHEKELLEALGHQFGNIASKMTIEEERTRLYNNLMEDLDTAQSVQNFLLPPWFINDNDILFSSDYSPSSKIGGDLFDMIRLDEDSYVMYIGDISGHGVQAALTMTAVKSIINMTLEQDNIYTYPEKVISTLNSFLSKELFDENYMTFLYVYVDLKENMIHSLSAGHPPAMLLDQKTGTADFFEAKGSIPLGWVEDYEYQAEDVAHIPLEDHKLYMLYTDGLFECSNSRGEQLGMDGLKSVLNKEIDEFSVISLPHIIRDYLVEWDYDISEDDFTTIAFCRNPYTRPESNTKLFRVQASMESTMPKAEECEAFIMEKTENSIAALQTKLVVNEFLNNIIEHGLHKISKTFILIEIRVEEDIQLIFRDKGMEWVMPEREDPETFFKEQNKAAADRGRGIQMIYGVANRVSRKRVNDMNTTVFTITC